VNLIEEIKRFAGYGGCGALYAMQGCPVRSHFISVY